MPAELFSVEQVERARRYHRPLYIALLLDVTLGLAVLSALAFTRAGSWLYHAVPEPLLGSLNLDLDGIHWLIAGGESGPNHRPMDGRWALELRDPATLRHAQSRLTVAFRHSRRVASLCAWATSIETA